MFKLNRAELKKIFLRPAVYVMLFVLAAALVIATFLYSPMPRTNPTTNFGGANQTIAMAFSAFKTSTSLDGKLALDESLEDAKAQIQNFAGHESLQGKLEEKFNEIKHTLIYNNGDAEETFASALWDYSALQTTENKTVLLDETAALATLAEEIYNICKNQISVATIDMYITTENLGVLKSYAERLYLAIPPVDELTEFTKEALVAFADNIKNNYVPETEIEIISSAKPIEIQAEKVTEILDKYYVPVAYSAGSESVLTQIYEEIETFVADNAYDQSADKTAEFNALTTKYKLAAKNSVSLLQNAFTLEKSGGLSDVELKNFIGFESFNSYTLTEQVTIGQFVLDNQMFAPNYLTSLGFNETSGFAPSAFDFCIYAMQILAVILAVFAIFFMSSSMAGDFQNGTIKMIAARPISRGKIVAGKTLASINFTLIFAIFSLVASLVVGYALYGFGEGQVLAVFNATTAFMVHPAVLVGIYFVCMMLGIIFFICLANLLAVIFRSSVFALFVTLIMFVASIILKALFAGASWFMYTPFAYLDLFGYLGGATATGGFLSFMVPLGANAFIAIGVLLGMIILIDIISKLIFKARDIT